MNYPIAIEHEPGKAYGVHVPDLPGCFSAGDTLDEAISNAAEALAFHIEGLLDAGEKIPPPQSIESHSASRVAGASAPLTCTIRRPGLSP